MEYAKVGQVMDLLTSKGIPADERFPGEWMPELPRPKARVWLAEAATNTAVTTVGVTILCTSKQGAGLCESTAATAVEVIESIGGDCRTGSCKFDQTTGLFEIEILAKFPQKLFVQLGNWPHDYATGFTAEKSVKAEEWTFRLEERIPPGCHETTIPAQPMSIICHSDAYHNCSITKENRHWEDGFLILRLDGTAERRTTL